MENKAFDEKICFSLELTPFDGEEFRDVLGYDGVYSVSNLGRVKTEYRKLERGFVKERIRKIKVNPETHQCIVNLTYGKVSKNFLVSHLVADAFILDKKRDGKHIVVIHKNKNPKDNRLENLLIDSKSVSCKISYAKGILDPSIATMAAIAKDKGKQRDLNFGIWENGKIIGYTCTRCFNEYSLNEFSGKNTFCNTCKYKSDGVSDIGKINRRSNLRNSGLQECSICNKIKPYNYFWKDKNNRNGIYPSCKKCGSEKHAIKKQSNLK